METNSPNEIKNFLNRIKEQLAQDSKREDPPKFPEEAQVIFKNANFKYELEELEELLFKF